MCQGFKLTIYVPEESLVLKCLLKPRATFKNSRNIVIMIQLNSLSNEYVDTESQKI